MAIVEQTLNTIAQIATSDDSQEVLQILQKSSLDSIDLVLPLKEKMIELFSFC